MWGPSALRLARYGLGLACYGRPPTLSLRALDLAANPTPLTPLYQGRTWVPDRGPGIWVMAIDKTTKLSEKHLRLYSR